MEDKNKHLKDWIWINTYPYNERWCLEEEIRESRREKEEVVSPSLL